jgi:hypothetical protein
LEFWRLFGLDRAIDYSHSLSKQVNLNNFYVLISKFKYFIKIKAADLLVNEWKTDLLADHSLFLNM